MADQKYPLGRTAVVYWNSSDKKVGDTGVETLALWLADAATTKAGAVRNLSLNLTSTFADTNTRNSTAGGFGSQTPVLKGGEVTFDTVWDLTDTFVSTLVSKWDATATMGMLFLNRESATAASGDKLNGFGGNFFVTLGKDENIDDVQRGNWTVTHADSGDWLETTKAP